MTYKEYLAKYFTNLVSVLTLLGAIFFAYNYYMDKEQENKERKLLEERYAKLINTKEDGKLLEYATQLATAYKDQAELAKETRDAWKELAKEREERIKMITSSTISVPDTVEAQDEPDYQFKTPLGTEGYTLNELRIEGKDSPPIGYVMIKKDGRTYKKNYKFEIKVESVQLKDDLTGKIRVITRAYMVPLENGLAEDRRPDLKKWKDEKFPLEVSGGEVVVDPKEPLLPDSREKGIVWWPMNINAGFGLFSNALGDTQTKFYGDTNLLGYGISKRDLDWKILHLGVNYNDTSGIGFHIMPFTYRALPSILVNTYVGPGYSVDNRGSGYFLGVNIGL